MSILASQMDGIILTPSDTIFVHQAVLTYAQMMEEHMGGNGSKFEAIDPHHLNLSKQ